MASIVSITAAADSVTCDSNGGGEHVFTVNNISGGPLRIGAQALVDEPCQASWLTLEGDAERDLSAQAADQIKVRIQVPADTPPARYTFRLLVFSTASPGQDFTESETAGLEVPPRSAPAAPPPEPKKFPWWIPVAIGVLVVVAVAAWKFWPDGRIEIPAVAGKSLEEAKQILEKEGIEVATKNVTDEAPPGTVLAQDPSAGERVLPDETSGKVAVSLNVAVAKVVTPPVVVRPPVVIKPPVIVTPILNLARWVAASGGSVPSGAVRGGTEASPGKQALYVCRAKFNNGTHPGKVRSGFSGCNIGWGGKEHTVRNHEVLVGGKFRWVAASGGNIASGAYKAGAEQPPGKQTLYVCRASLKNGTHPGKVRPGFSGCNIGWGGGEHTVARYEVLVQ